MGKSREMYKRSLELLVYLRAKRCYTKQNSTQTGVGDGHRSQVKVAVPEDEDCGQQSKVPREQSTDPRVHASISIE